MDKKGKGLIQKTWKRCLSLGNHHRTPKVPFTQIAKSKSWSYSEDSSSNNQCSVLKQKVAPEGCFSVYVGPQRQRFVIKTEYVNHYLFSVLLEEAELEYGYNSEGPLMLPCNVDMFVKVLMEIDQEEIHQGCKFAKGFHIANFKNLETGSHGAPIVNQSGFLKTFGEGFRCLYIQKF